MFNIFSHREVQVKTTLRFHLTPVRMPVTKKIKKFTNAGDAQVVGWGMRSPYTLMAGM
jgi:hypothetical protein